MKYKYLKYIIVDLDDKGKLLYNVISESLIKLSDEGLDLYNNYFDVCY